MQLRQVFSSGERLRDVHAADNAICVITPNRSPRSEGPCRQITEANAQKNMIATRR